MIQKRILWLWLAALPGFLAAGTTGKIAGTVKDASTGEPLAGANVVVEGTVLGAATDADGYYTILNVAVGTYKLHARYMGYKEMIQENIRISVDLTTPVDFGMVSTTLTGETVVVTAEKKLIRKDQTNTNIIRSSDDIGVLPIRGLQDLSASVAGVTKLDNSNTINIRGGRGNENAVYVDGVLVNDPYNFAVRAYIPNEAIEEMSVQTGGFNAEYGEAMSGIIIMTTNSGTQKYSGSFQSITDGFLSGTTPHLGTYSYGYNEYNATLGGPIIPGRKHTFFFSGSRLWQGDGAPSWGWVENQNKPAGFNTATVPGQTDQSWSGTGKVKFQILNNMELKSSLVWTDRSYGYTGTFQGMNPIWLYDVAHSPFNTSKHRSFNATLTHTVRPTTFYDLKFNWFDTERRAYDRTYKNNLMAYGDPTLVPDTTFARNPNNWGVAYSGRYEPDFFMPGAPYIDYFKNRTQFWGASLDITHQLGKYHTFKAGADYKYHTLREMRVLSPWMIANRTSATDLERYRAADLRFYGYDVNGNEVDDGDYLTDVVRAADGTPTTGWEKQEPYHPIIMSAYLQDKIELRSLILNLGLRYDRIDPNAWMFRQISVVRDAAGNIIQGSGMFGGDLIFDDRDVQKSEVYSYFSPRLGVSLPVSDNSVFHAQYGKFYQKPSLQDLYLSPFYMDSFVKGGYFTTINNPNLRPPKTTAYEVGFNQRLGENASVQLTAFYKETEDLTQVLPIDTDVRQIAFMQNGDFGVIKGFDVIFNLRRTERLSAAVNYEFQTATGTGSASGDNFDIAWLDAGRGNYPKFTMPLSFEQRHRGSVNVDYRLQKRDGPELLGIHPFEETGANLFFSFNSGIPFTRTKVEASVPFTGRYDNDISNIPVSAVNANFTPWNYRFDLKVDKTVRLGNTGFSMNVYLWVLNLLNTETIVYVFSPSGLPDQTGFLKTQTGRDYYNRLTDDQKKAYKMREMDYTNYGIPRQIRIGAKVSF
jgi:outer membrane receptor protein involved in Fe transport